MTRRQTAILFYGIGAAFIALNMVFIASELLWLMGIPVALAVALLTFVALDKLFLIITFLTPLSINLLNSNFGFGLNLPTEPLIFGAMLMFFYKIFDKGEYDKRVLSHPITWAIFFNLMWILVTTVSSSMPLVSFKFLLARLWFVTVFYFLAVKIFARYENIKRFLWLYTFAMMVTVVYTIARHAAWGFEEKPAHWVMEPFYNDHTAYGAILAMFYPVVIGFLFNGRMNLFLRALLLGLFTVLTVGIVLSYTRAAWVSLAAVFAIYLVMFLRIRFSTLVIIGSAFLIVIAGSWTQIMMKLEKNDTESSQDLGKHLQSVTNVSSDASNLERINRWQSALRMFRDRPVFGWGPGTYMFNYAPYQFSYEKTIISTNNADGGNAHSEYIGPLAEEGVLGLLTFLWVIGITIYTGVILFPKVKDKEVRMVLQTTMLGLITYYIHGTLNNFLDTDKASVPFWGFTAIIVAIALYHKEWEAQKEQKKLNNNNPNT
jgi:putative inorganic carbon (hco3(-)) transporter